MSSFKELNISNPGTSSKYGGDDTDLINKLFNGTVAGIPPVRIRSQNKFGFDDGIMWIYNQALSKKTTIRGQSNAPTTDVDLRLPPITGNDVLPALNLEQAWLKKQQYNLGLSMQEMVEPTTPGASFHHLFYGTDGHLYGKNSAGSIVDYDNIVANLNPKQYGAKIVVILEGTWKAIRADGTTISSNSNPQTVLQAAVNGLTASRTWKEKVKLFGFPTLSTLSIPSYVCLDLYDGGLKQADASNTNFLINSDTSAGNTQIEIMGGIIDGNKAGQGNTVNYSLRNSIALAKVTDSSVHDVYSVNSNQDFVYTGGCTNISVHHCNIYTPRKAGVFAGGDVYGNYGVTKFLFVRDNYMYNVGENPVALYPATDCWIERNACDTNVGGSGINCNGPRMHVNWNYVKNMGTIGLSIGIESGTAVGGYTPDESEVCFNFAELCPGGGIHTGASQVGERILFIGNKAKAPAGQTSTATGLRVSCTSNSIVAHNQGWGWSRNGLNCSGANVTFVGDARTAFFKNVHIHDNITWDNGANTADATQYRRSGINISNSLTTSYVAGILKNLNIHDNMSYDSGVGTQLYGLSLLSSDDCWIHENDLRNNVTGGFYSNGTNVGLIIERNKGYVTENGGSSTQSGNGSTKVFNIAHGLASAPTIPIAVAGSDDAIGPFKVTSDATNIIITYPVAPPNGTSNLIWRWRGQVV